MPKQLVGNIGGQFLKDSKTVVFHPNPCEALEALSKVMSSGFAGCVHFTMPPPTTMTCDIKVLILLYTPEKKAFLGFVPNNQGGFVDRLRKVIQQKQGATRTVNIPGQMPGGAGAGQQLSGIGQMPGQMSGSGSMPGGNMPGGSMQQQQGGGMVGGGGVNMPGGNMVGGVGNVMTGGMAGMQGGMPGGLTGQMPGSQSVSNQGGQNLGGSSGNPHVSITIIEY